MRLGKLIISTTLLLAPVSRGEQSPPDFSNGLSRLAALGLPDMEGAQWLKAPDGSGETFTQSYEFRELEVRMSGNLWKLPSEPPAYIEFGSPLTIEIPDEDGKPEKNESSESKPGILKKMLRNYKEDNPELQQPEPSEPESFAARDAKKIATSLAESSAAEKIQNWMRWGNSEQPGRLLLFAAQLHAAGETESANLLAAALFRAVSDDQALVDKAVSHLAGAAYEKVASSFFETYDWGAYQKDIETLLEKFPRGWSDAPAVALLLSKLEKRQASPPQPSLPGVELKPEALAQLDLLLEKSQGEVSIEDLARARGFDLNDYPANQRAQIAAMLRAEGSGLSYQNSGPWLLDPPAEDTGDSPVSKLKAMGMDGLIALAAVAEDETLVPHPNNPDRNSYYSSNESPAEVIRQRYRNLNRPATRGEIARGLLSGVIPTPEDRYGRQESDPSEIASAAIDFWKKHREKSQIELAALYLKEGSSNQQSQAATFLSTSDESAAHAAFEAAVLEAENPLELIAYVDQYLTKRKIAAKSFADTYIKLLRDNPPNEDDLNRSSAGWQIQQAGGLENYLRKLSVSVGDVSLRKLIANALKETPGKPDDEDEEPVSPVIALASTIQGVPLDECMIELGKVAPLATPTQWMEIHQLLQGRIYYELRNSDRSENAEPLPPSPEVLEVWKPLIIKDDPLPEDGELPVFVKSYGGTTTGDASALILELSTNPSLAYSFNTFAQIEGKADAVIDFVRQRTDAYTSGKEPAPWPSAENVSEERSEEISEKLATLPAAEIIPYAQSLDHDERLALTEIVQSYDESNPAPPGLLDLRTTIVTLDPIFATDHESETVAAFGIKAGDKVTPELITGICEKLLGNPKESSTTVVMFSPSAMNLGATVYVTTAKDLDQMKVQRYGLRYLAQYSGQFEGHETFCLLNIHGASEFLSTKDGETIALESEGTALEQFNETLETKSATLPYVRIAILTREDAEKITNQ